MSNNSNSGIGLLGILTIIFVVLKLTGLINWSWFWVLSPLWIGIVLSLVILLIVYVLMR